MQRNTSGFIALAMALSVALTGCAGNNAGTAPVSSSTPVKGGTFTVANTSDVTVLNPILNQDITSGAIIDKVFDSLLHTNDKMEFTPWLATEMPKLENEGLNWTFKLRGDVKWHDGVDFTSTDVKFTFGAIFHPGYTGVRASGLTAIKGADALRKQYKAIAADVTAGKLSKDDGEKQKLDAWQTWYNSDAMQTPDKTTVIFLLDMPFAPAMSNIGLRGILPEHLLKDQLGAKMKDSAFNRKPVGTGRYTFVEWKTNERVVLKANENWWGGRPNIDQYIARVFPDTSTALAALEKGEVDEAAIQPEQMDHVMNDVQHVATFEYQTSSYQYVAYDQRNPLFQDKNVRQALTYAVDKETLVKQVLMGHGVPAWSHGTPNRWDYNPNVPKFAFDKAKAETLLDGAGWKKGADGIRVKDGQKFAFDMYYIASQKTYSDAAQVVQAAWKAVGVEANLKGVDEPTLLDLIDVGNPQHKEPPAQIYNWSLGNEPDSYATWACDGTFNDIGYCDKAVDELEKKGRLELDQSKRAVIYQELQARLAEDQPYMFLWTKNALFGVNKRVQGPIKGNPNGLEYNIEQWWINPAAK